MHFRKMILTNESIWMCVGELELIVIFSFLTGFLSAMLEYSIKKYIKII